MKNYTGVGSIACCVFVLTAATAVGNDPFGTEAVEDGGSLRTYRVEELLDKSIVLGYMKVEHRVQSVSEETNLNGAFSLGHAYWNIGGIPQMFTLGTVGLDSDDRVRFNLSTGAVVPYLNGELNFSYRYLHGDLRDTLNSAPYSQSIDEHGFSTAYKQYFDMLIREASISWLHTQIAGSESNFKTWSVSYPDYTLCMESADGHGDLKSNAANFSTAIGADGFNSFFSGYRIDLDVGYEVIDVAAFRSMDAISQTGFAGGITTQFDTPYGRWKTRYKNSQSTDLIYTGWSIGPAELYAKRTNYNTSDTTEEVYGINFTFDLSNPWNTVRSSLFKERGSGYSDLRRLEHPEDLNSLDFIAKPEAHAVTQVTCRTEHPRPKPNTPNVPVAVPQPQPPFIPVCGDTICNGTETFATCSNDCAPVCGDAICTAGEDCPADCAAEGPVCGNFVCDAGESNATCPTDCAPVGPVCGDGTCDVGEECAEDCGPVGPVCGDGTCDDGEECAEDCGAVGPVCGNFVCEDGESNETCPLDCAPVGPVCGDGMCDDGEVCAEDCGPIGPVCGNEMCEDGESNETCPVDCAFFGPICGDGVCDDGEVCAEDCGGGGECAEC